MNAENPQLNSDTLLTLVVAELLLSPESGTTWIKDFAIDLGFELPQDQAETIDSEANRTLDQLAIPFVESLPEPYQTKYRWILEQRADQLHPLGEGHGEDLAL